MSFSFNNELILENNSTIEAVLKTIDTNEILHIMKDVVKASITKENLVNEFKDSTEVTGEHIKNYFAITLNGVLKVWNVMVLDIKPLQQFKNEGFYENVYSYLDELLDELSFDDLFKEELITLNN